MKNNYTIDLMIVFIRILKKIVEFNDSNSSHNIIKYIPQYRINSFAMSFEFLTRLTKNSHRAYKIKPGPQIKALRGITKNSQDLQKAHRGSN